MRNSKSKSRDVLARYFSLASTFSVRGSFTRQTKNCSGFTLLELLVVMVIIGLLVGYVAPNYFGVVGKSEIKAAKSQIDALQKAMVAYRLDIGHYPTSDQALAALYTKPSGEKNWHGPYMSKAIPLDPWGHPYIYQFPGAA